jgi:hypothetical protein
MASIFADIELINGGDIILAKNNIIRNDKVKK